jgi:UDP-3-O-[3-hydroxymyristoyl] glucosamine N-acyltransferase
MTASVSTAQIQKICENPETKSYLSFASGSPGQTADRAADTNQSASLAQALCFANSLELAKKALDASAAILILDRKIDLTKLNLPKDISIFTTPSISAAMALILPLFEQKSQRFPKGIHPTASIAKSAQIGPHVSIGAYVVVGENAKIQEGTMIGAQSVVEADAQIGKGCILHSHVFIGARCILGNFCEIHPQTTIGSDGFGFIKDPQGNQMKIPQVGIVVLEDQVEIGSHCAIDRATLGETRIGRGSKFDNFCHIAHNNKIGKNNVFAGGFMMAGSSSIGDECVFGGGTLVTDHVHITNKVIVGGKSGVTKDITEPGAYTGFPLEPLKDGLRTLANMTKLTELRRDVAEIKEKLEKK